MITLPKEVEGKYNILMKINIDEIKSKTIPILKEEGVTRSALFGSVARREAKEGSDIDMLVELPNQPLLLSVKFLHGTNSQLVLFSLLQP